MFAPDPARPASAGPAAAAASAAPSPGARGRPTDDDIEAIIQLATSARPSADGRTVPLKDTRTQLFVGNLPYRVRWQDLKDLFRKAGTVLRADVSLGPDNRSRGYGTVLLASAEDAGRAIDMFNGYSWQTRVLEVRPDRLPPDLELGGTPGFLAPGHGVLSHPASAIPSPMGVYGPAPSAPTISPMGQQTFHPGLADEINPLSRPSSSLGNTRTLFVGNLPFHCQWQDLKDLFRQAGTILRADVALGADGRSRGFGMVSFASDLDADRAVKMFNGYEYNGRPLKVHHDKFSHSMAPTTAPASPVGATFAAHAAHHHHPHPHPHAPHAYGTPPAHIAIPPPPPGGYAFEILRAHGSAPTSPYGVYPPHMAQYAHAQQQQLQQQAHQQQQQQAQQGDSASPPGSGSGSGTAPGSNGASPGSYQQQQSQQQQSQQQHQHQQHAHHPGPIALPPPLPPGAFPMPPPHTLSPYMYPMYGMGTPLHHPMSPLAHPGHAHAQHAHQHQHHVLMTPHGLPPITPSMPSFTFLPQPSPGGAPAHAHGAQEGSALAGAAPLVRAPNHSRQPSATAGAGGAAAGGEGTGTGAGTGSPARGAPHAHAHQHAHAHAQPSPMMAMTMNFAGMSGGVAMFSPGLPFSPGVAMTPGAFWGPAGGGPGPYINPAVGAPVHLPAAQQGQGGAAGSADGNGNGNGNGANGSAMAASAREDGGYFPPVPLLAPASAPSSDAGYFPPATAYFGGGGGAGDGARSASSAGSRTGSGSGSARSPTTAETGTSGATSWYTDEHEREREAAGGSGSAPPGGDAATDGLLERFEKLGFGPAVVGGGGGAGAPAHARSGSRTYSMTGHARPLAGSLSAGPGDAGAGGGAGAYAAHTRAQSHTPGHGHAPAMHRGDSDPIPSLPAGLGLGFAPVVGLGHSNAHTQHAGGYGAGTGTESAPPATRHVSADALGKGGAGARGGAPAEGAPAGRVVAPPGTLSLAGLGLQIDHTRSF